VIAVSVAAVAIFSPELSLAVVAAVLVLIVLSSAASDAPPPSSSSSRRAPARGPSRLAREA
jgi:hypothetical protein